MSWLVFVLTLVSFLLVFAEFGGRIRAANALGWWLFAIFLLVAAAVPEVLAPLAHLFGVSLVSNFVLAVAIVFLFLQVLQLSANQTFESRKLRSLIARLAAKQYQQANHLGPYTQSARASEASSSQLPSALIILPCFNEEASIPHLVPRLEALRANTPDWTIHYCFVDDGSTDATRSVLEQLVPKGHTCHLANGGVSCALITGFHIALESGIDYVVQCDGDGQHPVDQIGRLLRLARAEDTDLLIGSRFVKGAASASSQLASTTKMRRLGSLVLVSTLRVLWPGTSSTDPTSGFRIFSKRAACLLKKYMPDGYPEPETIGLCHVAGLSVREAQVEMSPRLEGQSSLAGLHSIIYMYKTLSALLGLRLRTLVRRQLRFPELIPTQPRRDLEGNRSKS